MNIFYVYALFRPDTGEPFYIGKGHGQRWYKHEQDARAGAKGHRLAIIRAMLSRGIQVPKVKLHTCLTEDVANAYEVALIAAIGRRDLGKGPLVNLTDGGEGMSGHKPSQETLAKRSAWIRKPESFEKMVATRAADGTWSPGAETRAKMAARKRGRKQSPEHIATRTATCLGRRQSPETIAKRRESQRAGTPERIAKMWATRRARGKAKQSPEALAKRTASRRANAIAKGKAY